MPLSPHEDPPKSFAQESDHSESPMTPSTPAPSDSLPVSKISPPSPNSNVPSPTLDSATFTHEDPPKSLAQESDPSKIPLTQSAPVSRTSPPSPKMASSEPNPPLASIPASSSDSTLMPEDVPVLLNKPGGIERDYGEGEVVESKSEEGAQDGIESDVVTGKQPAHPPANYNDRSVAQNANPNRSEDANNRAMARMNFM